MCLGISFSSPGSLYSCFSQWFYQASVGTGNLGTVERGKFVITRLTKMYKLVKTDEMYRLVIN